MRRTIFLAVFVMFAAVTLAGARQSNVSLKSSELKSHPLDSATLQFTITKFDSLVVVSSDSRDTGVAYIEMRVANASDKFATFAPQHFLVVSRDGAQASLAFTRRGMDRTQVADISVAPGAHTDLKLNLTDRVRYPARLYYDGELLAEITD